jgi:hypothetical protein
MRTITGRTHKGGSKAFLAHQIVSKKTGAIVRREAETFDLHLGWLFASKHLLHKLRHLPV